LENELTFSPVTDNSLLEFGETRMPLGDDNRSERYDITTIFEDGLAFGDATIASISLDTNGRIALFGPAGFQQGNVFVLGADLDTSPDLNLGEATGVFFDLNTDRDSVVMTWNEVAFFRNPQGQLQTFQLEIMDRGEGNSEFIFRYLDTEGARNGFVRLESFYGDGSLRSAIGNDLRDGTFNTADTRIGNTGIAGVEQVLLRGGAPFGFEITGTDADEVLNGGPLADVIDGAGGNDTIEGRGGADILTGGEGDDLITSSLPSSFGDFPSGALVDGGEGNDTLRAGDGADTITGGDGDDLINGGHGANVISGGAGDDIIRFGDQGGSTVEAGDGNDMIDGSFLNGQQAHWSVGGGTAQLNGGEGNDTILGTNNADIISGQLGNDSVLAGGGEDTIFGGEGDDILTGGQSNDVIEGGAGDDFIFGALGNDTATGGEGADRFFVSGQANDRMRILDYNYDEGDFLVLDGDLVQRDSIELRYTTALTVNGLQSRDYEIGVRTDAGFQSMFTFGNEAEISQILLRLPADQGSAVAPILFDLGDLIA